MKANELLQAQKDVNTVSIAFHKVSHFFNSFNSPMPVRNFVALNRLKDFIEGLMETEVSLKVEDE